MDQQQLLELLESVKAGATSPGEAADLLRMAPTADLGFATIDQQRNLRCGFPEVVFASGKTPEQLLAILQRIEANAGFCLATRLSDEQMEFIQSAISDVEIDRPSRLAWLGPMPKPERGRVVVITAGTSDLPVAREAELTARALGCATKLIVDVGVAGLHRLLARLGDLAGADAVVVVAGMEGALPSVVGGLVDCPVIAVPTSVGYGANFAGLSALLCGLTSCAANVAVVNIDAGFCGGFVAGLIARQSASAPANC